MLLSINFLNQRTRIRSFDRRVIDETTYSLNTLDGLKGKIILFLYCRSIFWAVLYKSNT